MVLRGTADPQTCIDMCLGPSLDYSMVSAKSGSLAIARGIGRAIERSCPVLSNRPVGTDVQMENDAWRDTSPCTVRSKKRGRLLLFSFVSGARGIAHHERFCRFFSILLSSRARCCRAAHTPFRSAIIEATVVMRCDAFVRPRRFTPRRMDLAGQLEMAVDGSFGRKRNWPRRRRRIKSGLSSVLRAFGAGSKARSKQHPPTEPAPAGDWCTSAQADAFSAHRLLICAAFIKSCSHDRL